MRKPTACFYFNRLNMLSKILRPKPLLVLIVSIAALYGFARILPNLQIGMD